MHQNIPGKCGPDWVGDIITDILSQFRPLVLVISEARGSVVNSKTPHGYTFIPGTLKYKKDPRISMLIKDSVTYKVEELRINVPTVCVKVEGWSIVGYYREWNRDGLEGTNAIPDQLECLEDLIKAFKKKKKQGKCIALGDMNVDLYDISDHQRKLEDLRAKLEDEIIAGGWLQMIKDKTRSQTKQRPSCIDHIYITHYTYVDFVENENISGTDHNLIGAHLRFDSPVFVPQTFKHRNVDGIEENKYEEEFLRGNISEVYKYQEVDLCLDILEWKILRPLNKLAPERQITTTDKYAPWMTAELKQEAKVRNKMRKDALESGKKEDWVAFKDFQKDLNGRKIMAKMIYHWRPIVLNCCMSKVLEVVINDQLMDILESWGLYSPTQHAYRHHRSVSSALQDLNTIQLDLRNRGKTVAILTTDVSAGFNPQARQARPGQLRL